MVKKNRKSPSTKKKNSTKIILNIIIFLSVIGLVSSLYLVKDHSSSAAEGSFCDITDKISCSLVNSSTYSELFNVPVALLGAVWCVILGLLALRAIKNEKLLPALLGWSILGMLFIIYMIIAEFILGALCPMCTVVHVIVLISFILILYMYNKLPNSEKILSFKQLSFKQLFNTLKPWLVIIVILNLIPLIVYNLPERVQEDHTQVAKCITESGVNMYGSFRCGVCAKTRAMFGDSFEHINEIECHPQGENPQTELCLEKEIEGTPTWILEPNGVEEKRYTGFLSIEELQEFSGCGEK